MARRPPPGLGEAGRKLWREVLRAYDVPPHELLLLQEAARTADELDRLAKIIGGTSMIVQGSVGQPKASPVLAEIRSHRAILTRILGAFRDDGGPNAAENTADRLRRTGRPGG